MKILIFSNTAGNFKTSASQNGYNGGGWIGTLQTELSKVSSIQLGLCFVADGFPAKVEQDGVAYYPVPSARKSLKNKLLDALHPHDVHRDEVLWPHYKEHFKKAIDDFRPDIIHIFGSELYVGLAAQVATCPCVLHIQGLLSLSIYIMLPPGVSRRTFIWKDGVRGLWHNWSFLNYWQRCCHREKTILKSISHVIGRTNWDREAMKILNPKAEYHHGGEILRPTFYEEAERKIPQRLTFSTTISAPSYKGYDLLLKVAKVLKSECHLDFVWNVYGNVDSRWVEQLLGFSHEEVNVCLCGTASAKQLREALLSSTLYFHPSYVENSPNSVCEAQLLGIPVVATHVGGTASLVEDGSTGLLFPATDPYMGAEKVLRLCYDRTENISMGKKGRSVALRRHDRKEIVSQLLAVYNEIAKK